MAKICLMNSMYPPDEFGGAENYVRRVAGALRERGHDAFVLTTTSEASLDSLSIEKRIQDGIPVYRFYPLNVSHRSSGTGQNIFTKAVWHQLDTLNPHAYQIISNFIESEDPDVVHTNNFMGITASAGKAISKLNCRHVHTLHDYSLICPKSNLLRERTAPEGEVAVCQDPPIPCQLFAKAKEQIIGEPDLVIGPSQHIIDIHQNHGFFNGTKSVRLQHGINTELENCIQTDDSSVIYVGKHLEAKGLDTLFEAARKMPDIDFHLCGTGPYDERTQEVAEELENTHYHGYVPDKKLDSLRNKARAAVVPSIWMENSPLTIYESFARGLPVVGSNIGGIPELINQERGELFEPGNVDDLISSVRSLLEDPHFSSRRKSAISWAKDHTIDVHIRNLIQYYRV